MSNELEYCDVTPEQLKLWNDTRAALVWHAPAFTHIFYSMMNKSGSEHIALWTKDIPVAATDGSNILINPDTYFGYGLLERVFVLGHEILHGIFGHCELLFKLGQAGKVPYPDGKELPFDNPTMQKALDYVVNDILVDGKTGQYNKDWLHDTTIATHMDSVLTAYRRIYQQDKGGGGGGGSGKSGQKSFDQHLKPGQSQGKDPAQAASDRNEVEWKTAIAGAVATAKAQGKLPGALERLLGKELEPEVDWTDKVIGFFNRKPGGGTYNWRKPDRRFITRGIVAPARSGFGCGPLVVAIDTSGSTHGFVERFFAEMSGILDDIRPTMIYVMWCDAAINRVDEVADAMDLRELRLKKMPGGGGTRFEPVFDEIDNMNLEPEALIYLTDGYGSFPKQAPLYPVLWGDISGAVKYPFGEVVEIPIK